jgi:hypothetical protein
MIGRRVDLLTRSYGLGQLERWDRYVNAYADDISLLFEEEKFEKLTRPPLKAALSLGRVERRIFAPGVGLLDVLVLPDRFIFQNFKKPNHPVQSWSRPFDAMVPYHSSTAKKQRKSVFAGDVVPASILRETFSDPIGVLRSSTSLYLYRRYGRPIGKTAGKASTNWVRLQCDRVPRAVGTGFRSRLHAYPVSEAEVRRDLQNCSELFKRLIRDEAQAVVGS